MNTRMFEMMNAQYTANRVMADGEDIDMVQINWKNAVGHLVVLRTIKDRFLIEKTDGRALARVTQLTEGPIRIHDDGPVLSSLIVRHQAYPDLKIEVGSAVNFNGLSPSSPLWDEDSCLVTSPVEQIHYLYAPVNLRI